MTGAFGSLESTLAPDRVRRDLTRLVPLAAAALAAGALVDHGAVSALAAVVAALGLLVCGLAVVVALASAGSRGVLPAACYGAAGALFAAAFVAALG